MTSPRVIENGEWLEADGLGGFASGTVTGPRTRRYHALLLAALTPPTGRLVLVNGFDCEVETPGGRFALSSQRYTPDVTHPDGACRLVSFEPDPWPHWSFRLEDGTVVEQELFVARGRAAVALCWRLAGTAKPERATLSARPFLSGRDHHATHHENPAFRFEAGQRDGYVVWRPYASLPAILASANGEYRHAPEWYRNFQYDEERRRGLDFTEDLASPGVFTWELTSGEAAWILCAEGAEARGDEPRGAAALLKHWRSAEIRRRRFASRLHRAADAYVVRRGTGRTIVAGYPWFTDWGRDTFIALRGLCIAGGRLDEARAILVEWASTVSQGMLPNRFPDAGGEPEFNSVDASLWYVVAVGDFLTAMAAKSGRLAREDEAALRTAIEAILAGYARGTRYAIRSDEDGLLAAGVPGVQLTWMDAKVGDWVVTPRIGKPVEVQALWLNALAVGMRLGGDWGQLFERGRSAFAARFWNEAGGYLHDVVDVDHQPGTADASFRPNQIFAAGALPFVPLDDEHARRVVDAVEARLLTPVGMRSLAPDDAAYTPRYEGGVRERDGAYHQGTVWPWLIGPFVEAWVRVRGATPAVKREARQRFLTPFLRHLDVAGLGHVSEIADAEPPHTPRGCPFQAWSVGEALRLDQSVLAER